MSWTRQRVTVFAVVIFIAHVIAIFALHTPRPMVTLSDNFRTAPLAPAIVETNSSTALEGLNDPLVFAGAHEHGFSASAWMMKPRQDYALTNSKSPPRFLAFTRTPTDLPIIGNELTSPMRTTLPFLEFAFAHESPKSTLRIQGALENRALLNSPEIPIQQATDVLTNTVIQIAVKSDGFPFSARIVTSCGSRLADLRALQIANQLRFAPASAATIRDAAALQWGECIFQWFTTEPSANSNLAPNAVSGPKVTAK